MAFLFSVTGSCFRAMRMGCRENAAFPPLAMKKALFTLLVILFSFSFLSAQNRRIDSLQVSLKTVKSDTARARTYNEIARLLNNSSEYVKAFENASRGLELAKRSGYKFGEAAAYTQMGKSYYYRNNYQDAIKNYNKCLEISKEIGDKNGMATALNNLGIIYDNTGDYPSALDSYLQALKHMDESGNKRVFAAVYNNIGNIYRALNDIEKSLNYHLKSLRLKEELKDKKGITASLNNIANLHFDQKEYKKALEYQEKCLALRTEMKDNPGIASVLTNIGNTYAYMGEYTAAEDYHLKALEILEGLDDKYTLSTSLNSIGHCYLEQKQAEKALPYIERSLKIAQEINALDKMNKGHDMLSRAYEQLGQPLFALQHYRQYIKLRDSLFNEENTKKALRAEMNFEYEKKEQAVRLEQEKKEALAKAELERKQLLLDKNQSDLLILEKENKLKELSIAQSQIELENQKKAIDLLHKDKLLKDAEARQKEEKLEQQRMMTYAFAGGGGILLLLSLLVLREYNQKKKANAIVTVQKALLEHKNREVVDSIHYAKRIQLALLKEEEHVSGDLPGHFVLFRPKDIVSGDFYWSLKKKDTWYVAVADCTGHGVPGAMMSMLGMAFLNEISSGDELLEPAAILDLLREKIIHELGDTGEKSDSHAYTSVKDGMDISMCAINLVPQKNENNVPVYKMKWAGANNPIWINRKTGLEEIRPDKQPIGYHPEKKPFTSHSIELSEGDSFYIFTDGYADQFGGPNGKKFKTSALKNLLVSLKHETMEDQKQLLEEMFDKWKGTLDQVDDVCMIGVKI
jgi:tetratricopeptide (TPR) repeat protein